MEPKLHLSNFERITKSPTGWIDLIIPSPAVINCRRYGAPKKGCQTKIWNNLKHTIDTSHGISTLTNQASPDEYHAGPGQESCLAPLIWSTISTQILEITEEVPQRVTVLHANNLDPASSQSEAYVDDTSCMVNLMHQPNRNPIEDSKLLDNKGFLEGRENIICLRRRIRIIKMCLVCPHPEMGLQEQSTPSGKHRHSSGFATHLRRQPKGHS